MGTNLRGRFGSKWVGASAPGAAPVQELILSKRLPVQANDKEQHSRRNYPESLKMAAMEERKMDQRSMQR